MRDETVAPARIPLDEGSDPVCWADRVCPECGRMDADAGRPEVCEACGAEFPD